MSLSKNLGMMLGVLVLVVGLYFYVTYSQALNTPHNFVEALDSQADVTLSSELEENKYLEKRVLAPVNDITDVQVVEESRDHVEAAQSVTQAQKEHVIKQEAALLELARAYDAVRADPDERAAHREALQVKLAAYNQDVLPIALEKINALRTDDQ